MSQFWMRYKLGGVWTETELDVPNLKIRANSSTRGKHAFINFGLVTFLKGMNGLGKSALMTALHNKFANPGENLARMPVSILRTELVTINFSYGEERVRLLEQRIDQIIAARKKYKLDKPVLMLLEHPDAYMHPELQAKIGHIIANRACYEHRFVIETHSEYMDSAVSYRIEDSTRRRNRRFRKTKLNYEDYSLLSFEKDKRGVSIYNMVLADDVCNRGELTRDGKTDYNHKSYRRFFMNDTNRTLGF